MTYDEIVAELKTWQDRAMAAYDRTGVPDLYVLPEEFDALKRLCASFDDERAKSGYVEWDWTPAFPSLIGVQVIVEAPQERTIRLAKVFPSKMEERFAPNWSPRIERTDSTQLDRTRSQP